jgi:hypothetical protein
MRAVRQAPTGADIAAQLDRIESMLAELLALRRPATDVRVDLLLLALWRTFGGQPFTAGEAVRVAAADLSTRVELRRALAGASAKALGKLLAQHAGQGTGRYRLERVGSARPARWRLCDFESRQSRPWHPS